MPNRKMLKDLFNVVIYFLKWIKTRDKRNSFYRDRKATDAVAFRKDFCTLRIGLPRRSGNTTLGLRILRSNPKALFFTNNLHYAKDVKNSLSKGDLRDRVFSKNSNDYVGMDVSLVIVDIATFLTERELEKIYSINCDAFILLG